MGFYFKNILSNYTKETFNFFVLQKKKIFWITFILLLLLILIKFREEIFDFIAGIFNFFIRASKSIMFIILCLTTIILSFSLGPFGGIAGCLLVWICSSFVSEETKEFSEKLLSVMGHLLKWGIPFSLIGFLVYKFLIK